MPSKDLYKTIVQQSPISTQIFTPDGNTIMVNKAWEKLWNMSFEKVEHYNILQDKQLEETGSMDFIKKGFAGEVIFIPPIRYDPSKTVKIKGQVPYKWLQAILYPIKDSQTGDIQYVVLQHEDITERREAEEAMYKSEERLRHALDAGNMGVWEWNIITNHVTWTDKVYELHDVKPGEFKGTVEDFARLVYQEDAKKLMKEIKKAIKNVSGFTGEFRVVHKNGNIRWLFTEAKALSGKDGKAERMIGATFDITERKQEEINSKYLSDASKTFVSSLEYRATLTNIAKQAVPDFANWCIVYIKDEHGKIHRITIESADIKNNIKTKRIQTEFTINENAESGVPYVIRTGKSFLYRHVTPEMIVADVHNPKELLKIVKDFHIKSWICVPLAIHGTVFGAISYMSNKQGFYYSEEDLSLAQELAQRAALAIENARLYLEAQKAVVLRDDFISVASHELKTPVTSLKIYTQVLQKQFMKRGETTVVKQFNKIDNQINKLTNLIQDLLNISKLESGKLEFQFNTFDLQDLINEVVENIQIAIKQEIRIAGTAHKKVMGDKDRIGQVLANLLTNASKYSPKAHTIIVKVETKKDNVVVTVQDFGIGIDKIHQERIFDKFYRVSDSEGRTFPGLGLGLYISNEIIKRHGGVMGLKSKKGMGSAFSFELPLNK